MSGLTPVQFLDAARTAADSLHWPVLGFNDHILVCQTPPGLQSQGEVIQLTAEENVALLRIIPVNDYFWDQALLVQLGQRFRSLLEETITDYKKTLRSRHPMHLEKYGALVFSDTYKVTPVIVYANVLMFLLMLLSGMSPVAPKAQELLAWGGDFRPAVLSGEWWRLFSSMFLHSGIMHVAMNIYALLYIGMFLEPLMGKFRFVAAYLLTGLCASLASITMHPFSVGVGASGAIFGMYGVFFALLTTNYLQKTARNTMLRSILFFIVFNLLMGIQGNVDNAAHIGGLLSGIVVGYIYYPGIRNEWRFRSQVLVTLGMGLAVSLLAAGTIYALAR